MTCCFLCLPLSGKHHEIAGQALDLQIPTPQPLLLPFSHTRGQLLTPSHSTPQALSCPQGRLEVGMKGHWKEEPGTA